MPGAHLILDRLRHLAARDNRPDIPIAELTGASFLFTFVTHERERIAGAAFSRMSIAVIVEGAKELVTMGRHLRFPTGTVLVLPAGWRGDVVNDPDPHSGAYRAVFIDVPDPLVRRAAAAFPPTRGAGRLDVPLDVVLAAAIHHAGEGIAAGNLPPVLVEHRVMEVLMVLGMRGALPVRPETMAETVRSLVRWQPDRAWTADIIAAELATSNATLRRRLSEEGASLRELLASERVALAKTMLSDDGLSLREAALASGYRSPRRFAERMRAGTPDREKISG
ncbi:helix-turn-helix transcriptional regulator [Rhizobium tubonense]|uniref:Transcriptional regulator n=1 Tax=Rhizobium tubonense TaxID=484088 RepID=A0A2W4DMD3_9HYPH|nr:helix-turn-helix domain-containing protein [Rhizobium tubonense]PZM17164.1 transcriptional regulator [Rhizobium tubonense]